MFENYQKIEKTTAVWTGTGTIKVVRVRSMKITLVRSTREIMIIILKGVLHVPDFLINLVFVSQLWKKGVNWQSDDFTLQMIKSDAEISVCKIMGSLFILQTEKAQNFAMVTKVVKNVYQKPN